MLRKSALLFACVLPAALPANAASSGFAKIKPSLALIGYPVDDKRLTMAFGTGFCVTTTATKSYFVTANHVVTDALGNVAANLFVIFPKSPGIRRKASVVRHSVDPDLAIVSIDAPCDGTVQISRVKPEQTDAIAIAGFPYVEVCEEAGLCSEALLAPDAHKGVLGPVVSAGTVGDTLGELAIQYNAETDHGNSGGPLYDPQTGVVYGVVVDELPGYSTEGAPSQLKYNRAVPTTAGLAFINSAPLTVALDGSVGGSRGGGSKTDRYSDTALGSAPCRAAWRAYDKAYADWAQAHGGVASLVEYFAASGHESRKAQLQPLAGQFAAREAAALGQLRSAADGLHASGATTIVKPAASLVDVATGITSADATSAGSLGSATVADPKAEERLAAAVDAMDSVITCL
jgi:hypothetical protein